MKKSLFPFLALFLLLVLRRHAAGEEFPYREIQQAVEGKNYSLALKLSEQLPEKERFYLSGVLKEKLDRYQEAIKSFQKYLELEEPKLLADDALFHIVSDYYYLRNFAQAIFWYEKAEPFFKKGPLKPRVLRELAKSYEKMNQFQKAIETYQGLEKDEEGLFHLANLYKKLGNKEEAIKVFWNLVEDFSRNPLSLEAIRYLESLQKCFSPEEEYSLAYVFYRNRLYREAEKRFSLLLRRREISSSLFAKVHYFRGKSFFYLSDYEKALEEYDQIYPESSELHYEKGRALQKLKRYQEAISEYEIAADGESLWQATRCYAKLKNYSGAAKTLEKLFYSSPKEEVRAKASYFLGKYSEELGYDEKAKTAYNRITQLPYTFYSYRACQEGKINYPNFTKNIQDIDPPLPMNDDKIYLSQLNKKNPELQKALLLLKLGISEEAISELKKMEKKVYNQEERWILFYLYQEARAYPQAIALGTVIKEKKLRYPLYYQALIEQYSKKYNLDPYLVFSILWQESRFGKGDVSSASAIGLMQIIPPTGKWIAKRMNQRDYRTEKLFEPEVNIAFGCYYFRQLLNTFDSNTVLSLCAYNAGPERTASWLKEENDLDEFVENIPFSETYHYVKKVISAYQEYQSLYK